MTLVDFLTLVARGQRQTDAVYFDVICFWTCPS
jgi:hypothetical protein